MRLTSRFQISFLPVFSPDHGLTGGGIALGGGGAFNASLNVRPGDIVTKEMVATTFNVALEDLQQSHPMASWCSYKMIENDKTLNVDVSIQIHDTAEAAAEDFRNATRNIPAGETLEAEQALQEKSAGSYGLGIDATHNVFTCAISAIRQRGIQFENVYGVADQARFETTEGTLRLQQGNLRMTLSAFYGPDMTIPDIITAESIMQAVTTWQQSTMRQRKEQTIALAKAALARL
ncbi:MAG TPA: hypothetical protein VK991_11845 [Halomonas sp.]|nr:hypothetical protein [Halomonas sp.]